MTYKLDSRFIGYPSVEGLLTTLALAPANIPWPPISPGMYAAAEDPVFGPGEFIFARFGGAIRQFGLCTLTPTYNPVTRIYDQIANEVPNTANLGRALYVLATDVGPVGGLINQYGWLMRSGVTPINSNAAVAAGVSLGIAAPGQAGVVAASKQILGGVDVNSATSTLVKTLAGAGNANQTGQFAIQVQNLDGLFVGLYVSGTGIGATALIMAIDRIANVITLSVANTAPVTGLVTFTFNNTVIFYNIAHIDRAVAQGNIT